MFDLSEKPSFVAILKTKWKEELQNGAQTGTMTKLDLNLEGVSLDDFNKDQIKELTAKVN